jgi:hypothetical protein
MHFTTDVKHTTETKVGTLVIEMSDLRPGQIPTAVTIQDYPRSGQSTHFRYTHPDYNGDEIAGWNYLSLDGRNRRLLIIND